MGALRLIERLFLLGALVVLTAQTSRILYVKFLQPRVSLLDDFDKPAVEPAGSVRELRPLYEEARWRINEREAEASGKPEHLRQALRELYASDYAREAQLRQTILDREQTEARVQALRTLWMWGLGMLAVGLVLIGVGAAWFGFALLAAGFFQMAWWSSGGLSFMREAEPLLDARLLYSSVTLALLLLIWGAAALLESHRGQRLSPASPEE